eukprot:895529_1
MSEEESKEYKQTDKTPVWEYPEFKALSDHAKEIDELHLRDLLSREKNKNCDKRNKSLTIKYDEITLDCSRQKATSDTLSKLITLAKAAKLEDKINAMFTGSKINRTENRSVLHIALRSKPTDKIMVNNINIVESVHNVLNKIKIFSNKVRSGEWKGYSNKAITNVISIGIGGSYLGAEFVYQSLKTDPNAYKNAMGRQLRFYANIDPIGFSRAIMDLDPETTLCIVVSKSFTTRETMMNASFIREWLINAYGGDNKCLTSHFIAVSANPTLPIEKFGVDKDNIFEFWDWVGGRYSVCSAVGILPLSLHYGYDIMEEFLNGCNNIDSHFSQTKKMSENIPILLGLFGIWNTTFLKYNCRALIPYCEALNRLPAHIQQLDMESNGKRIDLNGNLALYNNCSGEIDFGEPGTNAQHSFFQLIHQGRVVPADFIGFCKSQLIENDMYKNNKKFIDIINNNHNELMSNFFAQCDALALGKTRKEVKKELEESKTMNENKINYIIPHKVFSGNRPSSLLLFDGYLNAYKTGQILSIFEHRTVVQGFIWNVGSFDQWGVQLGKVLGKTIRKQIDTCINDNDKDGDKSKYFKQFTPNT